MVGLEKILWSTKWNFLSSATVTWIHNLISESFLWLRRMYLKKSIDYKLRMMRQLHGQMEIICHCTWHFICEGKVHPWLLFAECPAMGQAGEAPVLRITLWIWSHFSDAMQKWILGFLNATIDSLQAHRTRWDFGIWDILKQLYWPEISFPK